MRKTILTAAVAALAAAAPAAAANFAFTGAFALDDDVALFDFTVSGPAEVNFRTLSYDGGTNVDGNDVDAGGFDPVVQLFGSNGVRLSFQDDGPGGFDNDFTFELTVAGSYTLALSQFDNYEFIIPFPTIAEAFPRAGQPLFTGEFCTGGATPPFCDFDGNKRTGAWALDISNVDSATLRAAAIPEPAMLGLFGLGLIGITARRRAA